LHNNNQLNLILVIPFSLLYNI